MSLQLIAAVGGQEGQRAESGISGSLDIMTTTSNLSDEVSGEVTAEGVRELWRRAHGRARSTEVKRHDPGEGVTARETAAPEGTPVRVQVMEPSISDSPESEAQPAKSTALGLDAYSPHHYSVSQSGQHATLIFQLVGGACR